MNNKNLLDSPQPDPAWDYYILWHSLHHIKAKIDAALKLMCDKEYSTNSIDIQIRELLDQGSNKLIEIVDLLPSESTD